jgi:hypothetical protein
MFQSAALRVRKAVIKTVVTTTIVVGGLEYTTKLPSQGRSSLAYHYLTDEIMTPLMRKVLDAEGKGCFWFARIRFSALQCLT